VGYTSAMPRREDHEVRKGQHLMNSDQGLQKACATMTAVQGTLVEFGLHADNMKFNAHHQD